MTQQRLRKSVPFIATSRLRENASVVLIDRVELSLKSNGLSGVLPKLRHSLVLDADSMISPETAITLINDQVDCCLEAIYSARYWELLRQGDSGASAAAYVLEFYHCVKHATYHLGAGIAPSLTACALNDALIEHTIEEEGHETYFQTALRHLGLPDDIIEVVHPLPTTIELLYLMRHLGSLAPLSALACSALMEGSGKNKESVKGWHEMMAKTGALPQAAADALYQHVALDMECGHADEWEDTIRSLGPIAPQSLAAALNSMTILCEALTRWSDSLCSGLSDQLFQLGDLDSTPANRAPSGGFASSFRADANPDLLEAVTHGPAPRSVESHCDIARAYFLEPVTSHALEEEDIPSLLIRLARHYETHSLWEVLDENNQNDFTLGLALECRHVLQALTQSYGGALSHCPSPMLRRALARRWKHLSALRSHLDEFVTKAIGDDLLDSRPLSTTVAFCAVLHDRSHGRWEAGLVSLFYAENLLDHAWSRLKSLDQTWPLPDIQYSKPFKAKLVELLPEIDASVSADLNCLTHFTWSFLDGIQKTYRAGPAAVQTRLAWTCMVRPTLDERPM